MAPPIAFSALAHWLRQRPGAEVLVIGGFGQSLSMFAVQAGISCGARRVVYIDDDSATPGQGQIAWRGSA